MAVHISQAKLAPLMRKCEPLVVESQAMQNRRLQVVHMHRIFRDVKTEIIRRAIDHARFNSAARHPNRERLRMMIAPLAAAERDVRFHHRRAAKFAAPDHQRVFEQARAVSNL